MINSKIRIESRVIQHLGQDLITSPEVAVTELLKNSIDANSSKINIHIFDDFKECLKSPHFLRPLPCGLTSQISSEICNTPLCVIEDIGRGMTPVELDNGFLSVGTSSKIDQANTLGEKGIGRLSTQRLGKIVIVETVSGKTLSVLRLDWDKIIRGEDDVTIMDSAIESNSYTRIWIFEIELADFLDVDAQLSLNDEEPKVNSELKTAITFLISPFSHFHTKCTREFEISMYYKSQHLIAHLDIGLLECSESKHYFHIVPNGDVNTELEISYGRDIQPWYVERLHKVLTASP